METLVHHRDYDYGVDVYLIRTESDNPLNRYVVEISFGSIGVVHTKLCTTGDRYEWALECFTRSVLRYRTLFWEVAKVHLI